MMSLWDALRMNMMISYQELVRTFPICQAVCRAGMRGKTFRGNCLTVTHSFNPGSSARAT
ncbi:hypothetical protein ABF78_01995 [Enterobacter asburiae]|nr:hypothetical protein ABF78_01995 [Enterobacter asburiae]